MEPRMSMNLSQATDGDFKLVIDKQELWAKHKVDPDKPEGCGLKIIFDTADKAVKAWNPYMSRFIIQKDLTHYAASLRGPFVGMEFSLWAYPELFGMADLHTDLAKLLKELIEGAYEGENMADLDALAIVCMHRMGVGINKPYPDSHFQLFGRGTESSRGDDNLLRDYVYMTGAWWRRPNEVSSEPQKATEGIKLIPEILEQYRSVEANFDKPVLFKIARAARALVLKKAGLRTEDSFVGDFKGLSREEQENVGQKIIKYSLLVKYADVVIHAICIVVLINMLYKRNTIDMTEEIEAALQSDMALAGDLRQLVKKYMWCMYENDQAADLQI